MFLDVWAVALRKESVDRNLNGRFRTIQNTVALRKESVDRNTNMMESSRAANWSLSARRAWIEITAQTARKTSIAVALRKESVDRNQVCIVTGRLLQVALRKESVDRNIQTKYTPKTKKKSLSARRAWIEIVFRGWTLNINGRRSPQGERG